MKMRRGLGPTVLCLALAGILWADAASALSASRMNMSPPGTPVFMVDWQEPSSLPPRFRNHCRYDVWRGAWYCANHCGADYQFFFCSQASFGCCHVGRGYCDWKGAVRCAP